MKDLKRQLVSERRRAEKLQNRLQEVLSDSRNTLNKSRSRGFQYQTIAIWYYNHFVPKYFILKNVQMVPFICNFVPLKKRSVFNTYIQGNWLSINSFKYLCACRSKTFFIVRFISSLGVEDLLAGNDGNESLDRRSVWYCCTLNRDSV